MPTKQQEQEFVAAVVYGPLLQISLDWIQANLNPEDVFTERQLRAWAESNGYVEDDAKKHALYFRERNHVQDQVAKTDSAD